MEIGNNWKKREKVEKLEKIGNRGKLWQGW